MLVYTRIMYTLEDYSSYPPSSYSPLRSSQVSTAKTDRQADHISLIFHTTFFPFFLSLYMYESRFFINLMGGCINKPVEKSAAAKKMYLSLSAAHSQSTMNRTTREIESVCEYVCAAEYAYMQINRHNYKEGGLSLIHI